MTHIRQQVSVPFRYEVHFTRGLFNPGNAILADTLRGASASVRLLVVIDDGLLQHHPKLIAELEAYLAAQPRLQLALPPLIVPGGEDAKNDPELVWRLQRAVNDGRIDRHSFMLAIGGGALLDVAGYAAATAHRGVRLVRVPTTVLAQDDSAVGVKNGVNAFGKKNFLGTFAPPFAVLNDFDFLTTLDDRDWRGGTSEAVKVALLKDPAFFEFIEANAAALKNRAAPPMEQLIIRSAEHHLAHIAGSGDPFEMGSSRPLDFGHWSAHKLEAMTGYALRHGEAVAMGIALDCTYSYLRGMLGEASWQRIMKVFDALELDTYAPEMKDPEMLLGLREFREHLGGELTIMLLEGVGKGVEVHDIDEATMTEAVHVLEEQPWKTPIKAPAH